MEKISFVTSDRVTIVGAWQDASGKRGVALLLHMMPETKESYAELQTRLAAALIASLAIDLRGHGESLVCDENATLNYKDFDDGGHQASRFDIQAAAEWLNKQQVMGLNRLALVGASIGANLALQFAAEHREVAAVAALSPGLDYRGVAAAGPVTALSKNQKLLLVASDDDSYSAETIQELAKISPAKITVIKFKNAGHGTNMFKAEPAFPEQLTRWISEAVSD
ncbi:alpha/beta fold hydrolase [Patescibacteria group bacterium]|nr:MAG: alpha/beta fold hydrolase [Patescibacteria group bacterium]